MCNMFMGYKIPSCEIQKEVVKSMGCHIKSSMHCKSIRCADCVANPDNNVVEQYLKQKEQEMRKEFKVGDKVKCVSACADHFTVGVVYEVTQSNEISFRVIDNDGDNLWIGSSTFELVTTTNEMPKLKAGMVVENKNGNQYVYVHEGLSIGVGASYCGLIFNAQPLSSIVKIYKDVSRNLSSPQTEEVLWSRESSTDKAIRRVKEQKAKSDAEFEEKLSKLKETLK